MFVLKCSGLLSWQFVLQTGHFGLFFLFVFSVLLTVNNVQYNFCQWVNSNRGPLVLEATALPSEPQPQPLPTWQYVDSLEWHIFIDRGQPNYWENDLADKSFLGREPWSSGYGRRHSFRRLWVQILALYTGWTWRLFTLICCKNCVVCLKRLKINEKEAGVGPFF